MGKSKIEWCDYTWNPVWGCLNHCEYCYARNMAKRFYAKVAQKNPIKEQRLKNFVPTLLLKNLEKKIPGSARFIFVNSMSDIFYWDRNWLFLVFQEISKNPDKIFMFLTKTPEIYCHSFFVEAPKNCWFGTTINYENRVEGLIDIAKRESDHLFFVSVEPLIERIKLSKLYNYIDWIILGAETGNRKNKYVPSEDLIAYELEQSGQIPVFMKHNLQPYWKGKIIQEYPKNLQIKTKKGEK